MPKTTDVGGTLTEAEEASIDTALRALKRHVELISPFLQPSVMVAEVFKTLDRAYALKAAIDAAVRAANVRQWQGNVRTWHRGVSPKSPEAETLASAGIHTKEQLIQALVDLGLRNPDGSQK